MRLSLLFILFALCIGPILLMLSGKVNLRGNWQTANRLSAGLAPDPSTHPEAVIQIYAARAFNWHGLFAVHTWLALKAKNDLQYTVYQVVGWRKFRGLAPLIVEQDIPDRNWFGATPAVIVDIRGAEAEHFIPDIDRAAHDYPYPNTYRLWPGPNSNTFLAYLIHQIPTLQIAMPSNAIGKDYLISAFFISRAASNTGWQLSIWGILGLTLAKEEGLELNLFGLVLGINPWKASFKLPGWGEIKIWHGQGMAIKNAEQDL